MGILDHRTIDYTKRTFVKNPRAIARRWRAALGVLSLILGAIACSPGANEKLAYQSPAAVANNQANTNNAAGSAPRTAQSSPVSNENLSTTEAPPSAPVTKTESNNVSPPKRVGEESNPAPASTEASIAGTWQSPAGRVVVKQKGSEVSGTAYYLDGSGTGAIKGRLAGRKLSFNWTDKSGRGFRGTGRAKVSPDGRSISGVIIVSDGRSLPFILSR